MSKSIYTVFPQIGLRVKYLKPEFIDEVAESIKSEE